MFSSNNILLFTILIIMTSIPVNNKVIVEPWDENILQLFYQRTYGSPSPKVKIQLYYESLCPDCRDFDSTTFKSTVAKLAEYLDIHLYPYGKAETIIDNGKYKFKCQHGEPECYGNKLHACGIDYIRNITKAVFFTSCLMDFNQNNQGSDDEATDLCSRRMGLNAAAIKACAKSNKGSLLLKQYGDESHKAGYKFVPHILINGVPNDGSHFTKDVCDAIPYPPQVCSELA